MLQNSSIRSVKPAFKVILGLGLCGVGGAMLYSYFKSRNDEEDDEKPQNLQGKKKLQSGTQKQDQQKDVTIKITIANVQVPLVAGRTGANLPLIEEETQTVIRFEDKSPSEQYCSITGSPNAVQKARDLLLKGIDRSPILKEEIAVPWPFFRAMVRREVRLEEVNHQSHAHVFAEGTKNKAIVHLSGNRHQLNIARKLLEEKVQAFEDMMRSVEQQREPRRSPLSSVPSSICSSHTSLSSSQMPQREKLLASGNADEKPMEVYVSACASPSKFWVQLIGPQSKRLDDLVQEMTDYYNNLKNISKYAISEPYVGQIVATIFKNDGKWYRAEIVGVLHNQFNDKQLFLDLYFVDYGDSVYALPHEVFQLRTDFLTLRFQAIECFLANVKTTHSTDLTCWHVEAISKFEELTQVGNWKKLISRVVTYKERPKALQDDSQNDVYTREASPVPGVELYDPNEGDTNIGNTLISLGLALPDDNYRSWSPNSLGANDSAHLSNDSFPEMSPTRITFEAASDLLQEQLQQLQRNDNLNLNGSDAAEDVANAAKLSENLLNGNATPPILDSTDNDCTNGHLISNNKSTTNDNNNLNGI